MQDEDEYRVQDQVDDRAQQGGGHAHLAEALGVDEGIHAQADHDRDDADEINLQIIPGVDHRLVTAAHQVEKGGLKEIKSDGQHRAQQEQKGEADPHDPGGPPVPALPPGNGEQGRAAGAAEVGESGDDIGGGHHQTDAGKGVPAHGVDVADEGPVHYVIQYDRQLGHRQRNGQRQNVFGDAALREVVFALRRHGVPPAAFFHIVGYSEGNCKRGREKVCGTL